MSEWTEERISKWALDTFGDGCTHSSVACRANVEMAELLREVEGSRASEDIAQEAADVMIVLARLAIRRGVPFFVLARDYRDRVYMGETLEVRDIAQRANVALAQVIYHASRDTWSALAEAMALLGARLAVLCEQLEHDIWVEIDAKMEVNVKRTWTLDSHGHGQHVKESAS